MTNWAIFPLLSPVMVVNTPNSTFCSNNVSPRTVLSPVYKSIPRFVLSGIVLILTVIPTSKQVVEMYRLTKRWQINQYMKLFVSQGVLYFILYVLLVRFSHFYTSIVHPHEEKADYPCIFFCTRTLLFNILPVIPPTSPSISNVIYVLDNLSYSVVWVIIPRFIIGIRELYDRDLRRRWQGIDTGFGVFSPPISSENARLSTIAFVDIRPEGGLSVQGSTDDSEAIQLDVFGDGAREV